MSVRPASRRARTALPWLALAGAVVLTGCVVGPNYTGAPGVAPGETGAAAFHRAETASSAAPQGHWWTALGDKELDRLIEIALTASPDVEAAQARVRQARAGLRQQRANELPSGSVAGLYVRTKGVADVLTGGADTGGDNPDINLYDVGFDATWEVDLFGGQRRAIEGAKAQAQAYRADLEGAAVSLAADVAQAYVALRDDQQRLALSQQDAKIEGDLLNLVKQRQAGGTASELDVERLNDQLQSTRANLVPIRAQITEQMDRMAVLTGQEPGALDAELTPIAPAPAPPAVVTVGDPAALLRRRPDIRAAERRLAQQNAVIGQRTADLFPKVQLLGTIGFGSTDVSSLLSSGSFTYAAAPVIQWSPFDFGRTRAKIGQAKAARDEALADYRKTVLSALQDAETSLSRYGRQRDAVVSLARVQASADRAAALTHLKILGGTATTLDALDAERHRVDARSGLEQAQAQLTQDYVALQKSLGLGWSSAAN
ncbi:MAG: efflux transporter outer membrane subunit [Caulobacteraceae bacterium]